MEELANKKLIKEFFYRKNIQEDALGSFISNYERAQQRFLEEYKNHPPGNFIQNNLFRRA